MEIGGNMNMDVDINMLGHDHHHHENHNFNINSSNIGSRGQNGNNTTHLASWDVWRTSTAASNNTTTTDNSGNLSYSAVAVTVAATGSQGDARSHPLLLDHPFQQQLSNNFYRGGGSHYQPDPHLMCLKLGKRHYFEDHAHVPPALLDERQVEGFPVGMMMTSKRGKAAAAAAQLYGSGGVGGPTLALKVVPRCQVDGCHVALVHAKEYHRRHKVCEMHSKASKVTVLGQDQRFCQQCSRFHVVSEFDESKRSCRRRLAGHNERRRKSSHDSQGTEHKVMVGGKFQYLSSSTGRALSLLSSKTSYDSWVSPSDLSSRSSAALRELIAENRAALLARQLLISSPSTSDRNCWVDSSSASHNNDVRVITDLFGDHGQSWSNSVDESNHCHHQMFSDQNHDLLGWDRFHETRGADLTLDLRQAPSQVYGFLPQRAKAKAEEDQECDMWKSFRED